MRIYSLTPIGQKVARSTNNPDSNAWNIIHFLDRVGESTEDRIATYLGIGRGEAVAILGKLKRNKVVTVMGGE